MTTLKAFLGITIAFLGLPIILATFIAQDFWIDRIAATGLKISPWETGDEVAFSIQHDQYRTDIHKPVFDTLLGQREKGLVQVDWTPPENLPEVIDENIDYDRDDVPDFHIQWVTEKGQHPIVTPLQPLVIGLQLDGQTEKAFSVRVDIKNPNIKR